MGVGTYALTSLANVKQYLNLSVATHDVLLENCVDRATEMFENFTNRKLKSRDYHYDSDENAYDADNAVMDGNGRDRMALPQIPINSVTTVRINTLSIDARSTVFDTGYVIDKQNGIILLAGYVFTKGIKNIEFAYNAGYSSVPDDLEQAAIEQTAWIFKQSSAGSALLGVSNKTLPDGSVNWVTTDLLPQVRRVLNKYRKRFAM